MAITTLAGLQAAMEAPQTVLYTKTGTNAVQAQWTTQFDATGPTAAGTLAGTSTAAGVVPDSTTTGCPTITAFSAGKTGYIGAISFGIGPSSNIGCSRLRLCDLLFKAGAYSFNSNVTLASQPSYSARISGTDYKGTEIWIENVTAMTGTLTVTITYTNQDGTAGKSTSISLGSPNAKVLTQVPLASGDTGVQKIESVVGSVATVGTFNVLVLRPLWMGWLLNLMEMQYQGPDLTDLPIVFATSALFVMSKYPANSFSSLDLSLTVING